MRGRPGLTPAHATGYGCISIDAEISSSVRHADFAATGGQGVSRTDLCESGVPSQSMALLCDEAVRPGSSIPKVQRQSAPRHAKWYSSHRRSSNEDVAIFFSHGDAHALHARASERFLRSADVCSFPMRFNEAAAHRLKVVRHRTGRKGLPTAPSGTSYTYAAIRRSMSRRSRLKSSPSVPLGPKLEEVSCITKA